MEAKAKVVIDTNIYIEVFKARSEKSTSVQTIKKLREGTFFAILSPQILAEIIDVATRPEHGFTEEYVINFFKEIKKNLIKVEGNYISYKLDNIDEKDNMILAAGLEGKADYIISSDKKHILPLKNYKDIRITNPVDFLKELEEFNNYKKVKSKIIATVKV